MKFHKREVKIHTMASLLRRFARTYTISARRRHADVFPSQRDDPASAAILSSLQASPCVAQTSTEKIVQRYAQGLAKDQYVKAGDCQYI